MGESLSLEQARAFWFARQALDGHSQKPLADLVGSSGWLRTLAGADVYLAARARQPGMKRMQLDALVAKGALRVVPAARGCIYLVPSEIVPDLMAFNAEDFRKATERELGKIGKRMRDLEALAPRVLDALAGGPATTDGIRKQLGKAIPSFGEAGKKIGMSSPLPATLRMLELDGRIERTLEAGRLDTDKYLWRKGPRASGLGPPEKNPLAAVVEAFLSFAGPVTLAQISAWSGRPQREIAPIVAERAVPVTVEGMGEAWVRKADLAALRSAPRPEGVALLAFEDNYLVNHGTLGMVTDPRHHAFEADIWGGKKPEALGSANHVLSRTIVVDGLISGFWEVDPRTEGAMWMTFDPAPKALASRIDALTAETARFLLDELGHARTFSLDSMDEVQARADRIAKLRPRTTRAASTRGTTRSRPRRKASSARSRP